LGKKTVDNYCIYNKMAVRKPFGHSALVTALCFMKINPLKNLRILVIDDNHTIHEDIRRILMASSTARASLDEDEAALFGDRTENSPVPIFEIDSAYQGQEGVDLIEKSLRQEWPYAMAFVDVRMPPGRSRDHTENLGKVSRSAGCPMHRLF
jgi:CheY-like chemotaxis protein